MINGGTGFMDWVYQHETLTAGLAALLVAIIALVCQIRQSDRHNKDRRSRKFESARAILPLALNRLVDYAEHALDFSLIGQDKFDKSETYEDAFPQLPDDVVPVLREVIEYADDDKVGHALRDLISDVQVHHARMLNLPRQEVTVEATGRHCINMPRRYERAIWDAVCFFIHASKLFDYARSRTDALPEKPTDEEVRARMVILDIPIPAGYTEAERP